MGCACPSGSKEEVRLVQGRKHSNGPAWNKAGCVAVVSGPGWVGDPWSWLLSQARPLRACRLPGKHARVGHPYELAWEQAGSGRRNLGSQGRCRGEGGSIPADQKNT